MHRPLIILMFVLFAATAYAQIGGQRSFEFLNIPSTARTVGMGGINVSTPLEDVNLVLANPALSSDTLSGKISFNYLTYFADTRVFSTAYQHDFGKAGQWFIGVNHIDYGDFDSFDVSGAPLGEIDAAETAITVGRSHTANSFTLGASLKFLSSSIAGFNSAALAMDLGGSFMNRNRSFVAGLVFKNIGIVLSDYSDTEDSSLPFDIQLGASLKPKYMPFRFTITGYNLYQGDIAYFDPTGDTGEDEPGTGDKVLRHFVVSAELLLSKNFNLRAGYNHLVRQELKLEDTAGGAGFSFGLMFRIKAFEFAYSRGGYHAAGGSNSFTLIVDTNLLLKKRPL